MPAPAGSVTQPTLTVPVAPTLPTLAVNVALARKGVVIAGVTHIPLLGETFWAERGQGAFFNGLPIRVSDRRDMIDAVFAVGIPFASKTRHEQFAAEMLRLTPQVSGIRRLGAAAVDMAYVACGRFDGYFEAGVQPWDIAAGVLLVREAGGRVCDFRGNGMTRMDVAEARGRQVVAGNVKLVEPLQKTIVSSGYAKAFG